MRKNKFFFFFFNDTATTEIYTLSLHDALPISETTCRKFAACSSAKVGDFFVEVGEGGFEGLAMVGMRDRKSTRLNSSHSQISYAVFCLKKKKQLAMPILIEEAVSLRIVIY